MSGALSLLGILANVAKVASSFLHSASAMHMTSFTVVSKYKQYFKGCPAASVVATVTKGGSQELNTDRLKSLLS